MKGKQLAMDSALADLDRYALEKERRETDAIRDRLDAKYRRVNEPEIRQLPAGSVVIIGQNLLRNNHYTWHFYRTVLNFARTLNDPKKPVLVQANDKEWPDLPPWAETVGHEGELKDIPVYYTHIHWATGEIVEPIVTWWMQEYEMQYE